MSKYDWLIVGAGPFGCTLARLLRDEGKQVLLIDKRNVVGGNAFDEEVGGSLVHRHGAHIFHTSNDEVWSFCQRFADWHMQDHVTKAVGADLNIYTLPFSMHAFKAILGAETPEQAKMAIAMDSIKLDRPARNLEEYCLSQIGERVYRLLVKEYTEKQWGRPCAELPAPIIQRLPIRFDWNKNYYDSKITAMPIGGYTQMFLRMTEDVETVLGIDFLKDKKKFEGLAENVAYSGPIDAYYGYKFGALPYRSLEFKQCDDAGITQDTSILNYCTHEVKHTKRCEWSRFYGRSGGPATLEIPKAWSRDAEPYYPVRDKEGVELFDKYRRHTEAIGNWKVHFCGRLGRYTYFDMDQAMASAMALRRSSKAT